MEGFVVSSAERCPPNSPLCFPKILDAPPKRGYPRFQGNKKNRVFIPGFIFIRRFEPRLIGVGLALLNLPGFDLVHHLLQELQWLGTG